MERRGYYTEPYNYYQHGLNNLSESNTGKRVSTITSMLRVLDVSTRNYDMLRQVIQNELNYAPGRYSGNFDYILSDMLFREGKYEEAVIEFVRKADVYKGFSSEVEMLCRAAYIAGSYMDNTQLANSLADRASIINPGEPSQ